MFSCNEKNIIVISGADICMHFKDQLTTSVSCEAKQKTKQESLSFLLFPFVFYTHNYMILYFGKKKRFCAYAMKPYSL